VLQSCWQSLMLVMAKPDAGAAGASWQSLMLVLLVHHGKA
jgi:hypothetical protein